MAFGSYKTIGAVVKEFQIIYRAYLVSLSL
jgi:hypothetical protein